MSHAADLPISIRHLIRRRAALLLAALAIGVLATPAAATKRRAFVTSIAGTGDIASWPDATGATVLDNADSVCRARAQAAGLPNDSAYRAWLSTAGIDAYCDVQGLAGKKSDGCDNSPLPGGGPWYLADGISPFAGTLDQLVGSQRVIYRPVMLDEARERGARRHPRVTPC